jgi:hypothetical protein
MDAARPLLYAVFSSPLAGKAAAYERWYDSIHAPDSLSLGVFRAARRFAAVGPSRAAFLTLWEADDPDPLAALERVRPAAQALRARGRVWPVQQILFHQFLSLRESHGTAGSAQGRALTSLLGCWAEPSTDAVFRDWYAGLAADADGPLRAYEASREYGAPGKTLVLLESASPAERLAPRWSQRAEPGLPPFGAPTPIFRAGESPQQYAEPERPSAAQLARLPPAWAAHWRLVASYGASA